MNTTKTPAYAVAYLRDVEFGEAIAEYLRRIDATLAPYGGRFLVHGGRLEPLEGQWDGDLVILEFPDGEAARAWYDSPGYQDILALRTEHSRSMTTLVEGVPGGYRADSKIAALEALQAR
ncbi:DUF1330 domain-containing protein [Nocardioides insulae]|uniref:DUF1330 domain-containing protein n=1 Tax=Nocardioides insulae TaxID=394734 RepID=UPI000567EE5E|nr:DUF1330 domain-containing protein [Nocardioides insulae]